MTKELYVFIDNSFLFAQGYKHVTNLAKLTPNNKLSIDYTGLRTFLSKHGDVKRAVIVGSNLAGNLITKCQLAGFNVYTFPKYPDLKSGNLKEKGIDHKICWEIAKTIFTNKDSALNKKIILCTGDKDFMTVLPDIQTSNWEFELWLWNNSFSPKFTDQVKVFGTIKVLDQEWKQFIKISNKTK
jgi:uncharacterized LabA/DUF88 family protein